MKAFHFKPVKVFSVIFMISFCCLFKAPEANAQTNYTASIDLNGLIQINTLLPDLTTYEFNIKALPNITTEAQAMEFVGKYTRAGFVQFTFDMQNHVGNMKLACAKIMDNKPDLNSINHALKMVNQYGK